MTLWWEQCLRLLSTCVWKNSWWRSDITILCLSDRPWTIFARCHPCQNSAPWISWMFLLYRDCDQDTQYDTWLFSLPLCSMLQHVTSCFSLLTHCENSVCASKATDRGKMGVCSLYSTMNENSSSEIFLYINSLVAETLPHFFISILRKFLIQRDSQFNRKNLSIAWNTVFLVKDYHSYKKRKLILKGITFPFDLGVTLIVPFASTKMFAFVFPFLWRNSAHPS